MHYRIFTTGLAAIAAAAIMLVLGSEAHAANILISVTGTINTTGDNPTLAGYTNGQPVSFTWVVNDYAPATPVGETDGQNVIRWYANQAGDPVLFADFGGTGLTGAYAPSSAPFNYIEVRPSASEWPPASSFAIWAGSNTGSIGLVTPDSAQVREVRVRSTTISPFPFIMPGTIPNPATYFADYFGSYAFSGSSNAYIRNAALDDVHWTPQTLTISPVPEPSTVAMALAGLACCGCSVLRRRKRS